MPAALDVDVVLTRARLASFMPRSRGRPPLPPRTNPDEIKRVLHVEWARARDRALSGYDEPAAKAQAARIIRGPGATSTETKDGGPDVSTLSVQGMLTLASPETSPVAEMARALPPRPAWIVDAFINSVPVAKEKFGPDIPEFCRRISRPAAECLLHPTQVESFTAYVTWVAAAFLYFAEGAESVPDYADVMLRVLVPTYNAFNFSSRRCLDCGRIFALRTPKEVAESRHCSDECGARSRNRGRDKATGGRSETRASLRLKRHWENCPNCSSGCPTYMRLINEDANAPPILYEHQQRRKKP